MNHSRKETTNIIEIHGIRKYVTFGDQDIRIPTFSHADIHTRDYASIRTQNMIECAY